MLLDLIVVAVIALVAYTAGYLVGRHDQRCEHRATRLRTPLRGRWRDDLPRWALRRRTEQPPAR